MSFEPINIEFLINSDEVKTSANQVKKNLMDIGYSAEEAEKKINQRLNAAIERQAFKSLPALQQQGVKTQRVWNGLGNSINQLSREIPAFAVNTQTGFLAISNNLPILADEIQRLRLKNEALVASGKKGIPVWKQVLKGVISWQTALSVGVALLTIYGKDIVDWIGAVFKGKNALDELKSSQEALNEAYKSSSYKKVIKDLFELNSLIRLAKKGTIDKESALKKYNETLGKAAGKTDDLTLAEKNVREKTPAWVKAMVYRAAAMAAASKAAEKLAENQAKLNEAEIVQDKYKKLKEEAEKSGNTITSSSGVGTIQQDAVYKATDELNKLKKVGDEILSKSQNVVDKLLAKAAEIAKTAGLNIFGSDDDKNPKKTISQYQRLMDKLADIDKEYARKSFTKDEEEIQALKDKFAKIRTLVERYNADPKNKAKIIDLTAFNNLEDKATADVIFRQETEKLKTELQEKQKLYKEFEDYKKSFGAAAAKKEYADKIGEAETYYEFLKDQERKNKTAFTAVKNGTATGGQIERVNFINNALNLATKEQQQIFNEQLADLLSYHQKRAVLIENYNNKRAKLIKEGKVIAAVELDKQHKEELDKLDDSNIKKLRSYKELQKGVVGLSKKQAQLVIENAKVLLERADISEELKERIRKTIEKLEKEIKTSTIDNLFRYTERLGDFGDALQDLGNVLGSSDVRNAGEFLSGIAKGLDDLFDALEAETKEEKIAAGIGAAISLISTFTSAAAKRKAAEEEYYLNVIGFQNDYNLALIEQKRLQSELAENVFLTDYVGRIQDSVAAIYDANNEMQSAIADLAANGQVITGQSNAVDWGNVGSSTAAGASIGSVVPVVGTLVGAIGGFVAGLFGGGRRRDNFRAILQEYPELITEAGNGLKGVNVALAESLLANELVKGETAEILQNILDWQKALDEARAQINEVISTLAGGLGDDLRTALVDAFVAGEDAAIKMGDTVEKSFRKRFK